jgi:hypothetical protein
VSIPTRIETQVERANVWGWREEFRLGALRVKDRYADPKKKADELHKTIVRLEKDHVAPYEAGQRTCDVVIKDFDRREDQRKAEVLRAANAEQDRLAAEAQRIINEKTARAREAEEATNRAERERLAAEQAILDATNEDERLAAEAAKAKADADADTFRQMADEHQREAAVAMVDAVAIQAAPLQIEQPATGGRKRWVGQLVPGQEADFIISVVKAIIAGDVPKAQLVKLLNLPKGISTSGLNGMAETYGTDLEKRFVGVRAVRDSVLVGGRSS